MNSTAKHTGSSPPSEGPPHDGPAPRLGRVLERLDTLESKLDALRTEADPDALLTEQQAAELLGVSTRTMQTMRAAGEINALRVRSAVRYTRAAVRNYVRRQAEGAGR